MSDNYALTDLEGTTLGEAEVSLLSEGDLCVSLGDGEAEKAIVLVEARADGTFAVRILNPDASLIHGLVVGEPRGPKKYTLGYHGSDTGHVHVALSDRNLGGELFDVALYDREVVDTKTGVDGEEQSLRDLRKLLGYANAAIEAGLDPEPVADKIG